MKKKRIMSGIVFFLLIGILITGCPGAKKEAAPAAQSKVPDYLNETGYPVVKQPVTMSLVTFRPATITDPNDMKFFKRMADKTGVNFTITMYDGGTIRNEQFNLLMATQTYPDLFIRFNITRIEEMQYGVGQGLFIPLEDMIQKYNPNLQAQGKKMPGLLESVVAPDGHTYSIPDWVNDGASQQHIFINYAWLKKLGISEPTNPDEFFKTLTAFKTIRPDAIPLTGNGINSIRLAMLALMGFLYEDSTGLTDNNGKLEYAFTSPAYKEWLAYMKRLWDAKLLDQDIFTQTGPRFTATATEGRLGVFPNSGSLIAGDPGYLDYLTIVPWTKKWPLPGPRAGTFVITDKNKYPEAALRWVDFLYTEDGKRFAWMGAENEDYKFKDNGRWDWIVPEGLNVQAVRQRAGLQGGMGIPAFMPERWWLLDDKQEQHVWKCRERINPFDVPIVPDMYMNADDLKKVMAIHTDIVPYVNQYLGEVITGKSDLNATWDGYVSRLSQMGLQAYLDNYQTAYNRYLAVKK